MAHADDEVRLQSAFDATSAAHDEAQVARITRRVAHETAAAPQQRTRWAALGLVTALAGVAIAVLTFAGRPDTRVHRTPVSVPAAGASASLAGSEEDLDTDAEWSTDVLYAEGDDLLDSSLDLLHDDDALAALDDLEDGEG